jgi:hypothetical protein
MKEIWKDIPNYEGLYQVSSKGNVRRITLRPHILNQSLSNCGYKRVVLCKNNTPRVFSVHRIVAEVFIDNPDNKPTVNHIDGNKENNSIDNLEWATRSEQEKWKYKLGYAGARARKVICVQTGKVYGSLRKADRDFNLPFGTVWDSINSNYLVHKKYRFKYV